MGFGVVPILAVLAAFGIAVLLFEKGEDWPVKGIRSRLETFLGLLHPKAREMFDCPVCTSFWAALVVDLLILFLQEGIYFFWPVSGFAACAFTWIVYLFLEAIGGSKEEDTNGSQDDISMDRKDNS